MDVQNTTNHDEGWITRNGVVNRIKVLPNACRNRNLKSSLNSLLAKFLNTPLGTPALVRLDGTRALIALKGAHVLMRGDDLVKSARVAGGPIKGLCVTKKYSLYPRRQRSFLYHPLSPAAHEISHMCRTTLSQLCIEKERLNPRFGLSLFKETSCSLAGVLQQAGETQFGCVTKTNTVQCDTNTRVLFNTTCGRCHTCVYIRGGQTASRHVDFCGSHRIVS
ncbi:hypothetical protein AGLY_014452 [Aphis glycines]|uniref:Uncharacterized protein n=1 Tax=Aphis glycines TaxID=307491 RepID=A0A6G0T3P8_APHGL|nr:hypothetical protein AGLY_014452 [Aphis glycines]